MNELLNNIFKHAGASEVLVQLVREKERISITVEDNGKGFEIEKIRRTANGLKNMKSRMTEIGGSFEINSSQAGTHVSYSMFISPE